jgi:hypothetical protein
MIRIRRCEPRGIFRRPRYEIELGNDSTGTIIWLRQTSTPVTLVDPHVGIAEAWALINAADRAWDTGSRDWIFLPGSGG